MTLENYCKEIEKFLRNYLKKSGCEAFVLGVSGGVDSSLVAAIARKAVGKDKLFCYSLPIHSIKNDEEDAKKLAKQLDINLKVVNLTETFDSFVKELDGKDFTRLTKSNLKVRMRMSSLYAFAQEHKAIVLGTDNWDESYVGYFTKYGDGGVDVLPIVHLTKREVREAAKLYGVSDDLAERVASAGLFEGQTDEGEMGIKYDDLDNYLLGNEVPEEVKNRIEHLHKVSEHKRNPIPSMHEFIRD